MTASRHAVPDNAGRQLVAKAYADLQRRLSGRPGPLELSSAYQDHRHTMFVKPGKEGLVGPDAVYHLPEAAEHVWVAAEILAGIGHGAYVSPPLRPRAALLHLMRGHGWRYVRGVEGLADALRSNKFQRANFETFLQRRADFEAALSLRAVGADIVNDRGENPAAVVTVISLFVDELHSLVGWLECSGGSRGVGDANRVTDYLRSAERVLAGYGARHGEQMPTRRTHTRQPRRR